MTKNVNLFHPSFKNNQYKINTPEKLMNRNQVSQQNSGDFVSFGNNKDTSLLASLSKLFNQKEKIENPVKQELNGKLNEFFDKDFASYLETKVIPKIAKPNHIIGIYQPEMSKTEILKNLNEYIDNEKFRTCLEKYLKKKDSGNPGKLYWVLCSVNSELLTPPGHSIKTPEQKQEIISSISEKCFKVNFAKANNRK